jgi:hypothetical protein
VEKLRWAEKEWRELDKELARAPDGGAGAGEPDDDSDEAAEDESETLLQAVPAEPA